MYRLRTLFLKPYEQRLVVHVFSSLRESHQDDVVDGGRQSLTSFEMTVGGSCWGSARLEYMNSHSQWTHTSDHDNMLAVKLERDERAQFDCLGRLIDDDHLKIKLLQNFMTCA